MIKQLLGGSVIEAIGNAADKLFTSDEEKAQAKLLLEKLRQQPQLLQIEVNKIEAKHRSVFVAGWRPFIGWVCGVAFAYHFVLAPVALFASRLSGFEINLPEFDMQSLLFVLGGMLGIGGLRTYEKKQGLTS